MAQIMKIIIFLSFLLALVYNMLHFKRYSLSGWEGYINQRSLEHRSVELPPADHGGVGVAKLYMGGTGSSVKDYGLQKRKREEKICCAPMRKPNDEKVKREHGPQWALRPREGCSGIAP